MYINVIKLYYIYSMAQEKIKQNIYIYIYYITIFSGSLTCLSFWLLLQTKKDKQLQGLNLDFSYHQTQDAGHAHKE